MRWTMFIATCALAATANGAQTTSVPCMDAASRPLLDRLIEIEGAPQRVALPARQGSTLYVQVAEQGIDVEVSLVSAGTALVSGGPLNRSSVQHMVVEGSSIERDLVLRSVDEPGHRGIVRVLLTELPAGPLKGCEQYAKSFARADRWFASHKPERAELAYREIAQSEGAKTLHAVRGEAELAVAALNYLHLERWQEAATWAGAAAESLKMANRPYLQARAQSLQAASWLEKPDTKSAFERARRVFKELTRFHHSRGEAYEEALQINFMGVSYFNEAQFTLAARHYAEARLIFDRIREKQRSALALQNVALCEWGQGRIGKALGLFNRALADMNPEWQPKHFMLTLNNAALANQAAGRFDESLSLLERALDLEKKNRSPFYLARSKFGIGTTYYGLGDASLARQFLLDALAIWTPQLDERGRLQALRSLAIIENEAGNLALADRYNSEALGLARSGTARDRIKLRMAETAMARGELPKAASLIEPLAGSRPSAERLTQAEAWVARAKLRIQQKAPADAERDLRQALLVFADLETLAMEFEARVQLAEVLSATGRKPEALLEVSTALARSEELRAQTANPEYRASVARAIRPALDLRLDLLWEVYSKELGRGNAGQARKLALRSLALSDAARGRVFEQYRGRGPEGRDDKVAKLIRDRALLLREIADRRYYLATREDRAGPDDQRSLILRDDIRRMRVSLGVIDATLAKHSGNAAPDSDDLVDGTLRRLAASNGVGAVEYWIGARAAYAWTVNQGVVSWVRLADGASLSNAARDLHSALQSFASVPKRERLLAAEKLHRLAIAPIEKQMAGTQEWIVVPDGPLHFVPFAALRESGREPNYLIEKVSISMTPALRHISKTAREANGAGRLLLVSDPIYQASDSRLPSGVATAQLRVSGGLPRLRSSSGPRSWARLPATAREARAIRSLYPAAQIDELNGARANREEFLSRDLSRYRILHVAAHGVMDAEIPAMSALILGAFDGRGAVRDQEIRAGDFISTRLHADLVVLSACNTSLGPSFPDEGPMGLRYIMLARGARAVVSSLWATADEINADLMTEMYGRLIGKGERVELALAEAMRAMLVRNPGLDPAFWAPYSVYVVDN